MWPAWSPDGKQVAFTTNRDGNYEIYVMNADGSDPRNLTRHRGQDNFPAWSPDGKRVAFVSNRAGGHDVYVTEAK
jgi:TolB protein